jgi:hypothetical protein
MEEWQSGTILNFGTRKKWVVSVMIPLFYFGFETDPGPIGQETEYVRGPSGPYGICLSVIPVTYNSTSNDRMITNNEFVEIRKGSVVA